MIFTLLLSLVDFCLNIIFGILPNLPMLDLSLLDSLNQFVNIIFDHLELLGFFIDIDLIKLLLPWVILVINFEHIYHFAIWILKKVPIIRFN